MSDAKPFNGEIPTKRLSQREQGIVDRLNGKEQGTFSEYGCLVVSPDATCAVLYLLDNRLKGTRFPTGTESFDKDARQEKMGNSVFYELGRYLQENGMLGVRTPGELMTAKDAEEWSKLHLEDRLLFTNEDKIYRHVERDGQRFMSVSRMTFNTPEEVQAVLGLMGADARARTRIFTGNRTMYNEFDHALPNFTLANEMLDQFAEVTKKKGMHSDGAGS